MTTGHSKESILVTMIIRRHVSICIVNKAAGLYMYRVPTAPGKVIMSEENRERSPVLEESWNFLILIIMENAETPEKETQCSITTSLLLGVYSSQSKAQSVQTFNLEPVIKYVEATYNNEKCEWNFLENCGKIILQRLKSRKS